MDKRFPIEDQIAMLAASLKGRVVTPLAADYDALRQLPHANFEGRPAAVIRPANAADVAAVINFARATDLPLAVRSGGHSVCGLSVNTGGLVLDLRDLNRLEIDAASRTAWAGSGLTAGEVLRAVEAHGLVIGFGDSATVGIGGLTLGGGIGYLTRKFGLTMDALLAVEVVTAGGDIVIASETENPELFWALRGGGGNFGVATRFRYRLQPLPELIGGPLILPATSEVLAGFVALAEAAPDELSAIVMVMPAPPLPFLPPHLHGQTVFMATMAYAGPAAEAEIALRPFRALATPLADLVGPVPLSALFLPEDPNMRPAVSIRTQFVDTVDLAMARRLLAELDKGEAPMRMLQIRVLGGAMARVADDATAFAHRKAKVLLAFLALFGDPAETPRHDAWVEAAHKATQQGEDRAYVNFLAAEGRRVTAAYPPATWARLQAAKRRYDPENLFRANQNIPPR